MLDYRYNNEWAGSLQTAGVRAIGVTRRFERGGKTTLVTLESSFLIFTDATKNYLIGTAFVIAVVL